MHRQADAADAADAANDDYGNNFDDSDAADDDDTVGPPSSHRQTNTDIHTAHTF